MNFKLPSQKIFVLYDIACAFHSHVHNNKSFISQYKDKFSFGVSIFHSYAHTFKCQVNFSPRRIKNMGLTDGESLERLWSYLGKFVPMTRYMRPNHRLDILAYSLENLSDNMTINLGKSIKYFCN